MGDDRIVVLYDRDCRWCRWSVSRLVPLDRHDRLRLLAIQEEEADRLLARVPPDRRLDSAHAVTPDGAVFSGGDAAAPIAAVLPSTSALAPALRSAAGPVRGAYGLVAANRSRLGRALSDRALQRADRLIASRSA